ncbi:MAG: TonB-dependent receptor [Flavobacteriia bacterium]|nr:TonB-dependent receptor [Flavobacteriia bacterium]
MKKYVLFACALIGCTAMVHAQKVNILGVVKDSLGVGLDMANVVAINEASGALDGFGITDPNGRYKIAVSANTQYRIKISYIGFTPKEYLVTTSLEDFIKDVTLMEQAEALDEVELTYEIPVTIQGDTIVYNTDSFVSGTEKKLGDVIKKLPGLEINDDGEIEAEGKKVGKIMVNGKDFFDGDTKLATKNIPANAVSKVEVLRNYSEVSQLSGVTNNQDNVAINIKLKEGKERFWFGEMTAGLGLDNTFLAHPKLFYYSPKLSVNVITDFNNIGELPFTPRDYFNFTGGMSNFSRGGGTQFNATNNSLGISLLQNNRAKAIDTKFGATNFNYTVNESLDLSGFAIYSYTGTQLEVLTNRQFIVSDQREQSTTNTDQKATLGLAKFSSRYKPSALLQWDYDVLLKDSSQEEERQLSSQALVSEDIEENKTQDPITVTQNTGLYYTLSDQHIFAFQAQHMYQKEDPFYNAVRTQEPFNGVLPLEGNGLGFNINQSQLVTTNKLDAKLDYYWVTGAKSNLNFTLGTILSQQDFDSDIFEVLEGGTSKPLSQDLFKNRVGFNFTDLYAGFHYKVIAGKFTLNPGFNVHSYRAENSQLGTNVTKTLTNLVPDLFVNVQLRKTENIRMNYSISREFTDINNLAAGYVFSNYNAIYQGNRELESALYHNASLNFFSFNMFNFQNIFANFAYNKRIDAFKNSGVISGINQVNTTINAALPDETFSGSANYQRTFGKLKVSSRANFSSSLLNNVINNTPRVSKSFTQTYRGSLATNFRSAPNVELGYSYSVNDYNNAGRLSTFYTDQPFVKLDMQFLKSFIFTADYDYYHYRDAAKTADNEYAFLNANLSFQKPESKWEYSLQVSNALNTEALNQDGFNDLFISSTAYMVQPRYVVFKIKYEL